jgi:hypothetical protein
VSASRGKRVLLGIALLLAAVLVAAVGVALELKRRRARPTIVAREPQSVFALVATADGRSLVAHERTTESSVRDRLPPEFRWLDLEDGAPPRNLERELNGSLRIAHAPRELALLDGRPGLGAPSVGGLAVHDLRALALPKSTLIYGFSSDGRSVLTSDSTDRSSVSVWDVATGKRRCSISHNTNRAALSPDGARFAVASEEVTVCDAARGNVVAQFGSAVVADVFFVDPDHVLVVDFNGLGLWEVTSGKKVNHVEGSGASAIGADLSHDCRFVAVLSNDGVLRIHDTHTLALAVAHKLGDEIPELEPRELFICVAFAPANDAVFVGTLLGLVVRVPVHLPERP